MGRSLSSRTQTLAGQSRPTVVQRLWLLSRQNTDARREESSFRVVQMFALPIYSPACLQGIGRMSSDRVDEKSAEYDELRDGADWVRKGVCF